MEAMQARTLSGFPVTAAGAQVPKVTNQVQVRPFHRQLRRIQTVPGANVSQLQTPPCIHRDRGFDADVAQPALPGHP